MLSERLYGGKFDGENFNIGPNSKNNETVYYIAKQLIKKMNSKINIKVKKSKFIETFKLNLNTTKIEKKLGWKKILDNDHTLELISSWYKAYNKRNNLSLYKKSQDQINEFLEFYYKKK